MHKYFINAYFIFIFVCFVNLRAADYEAKILPINMVDTECRLQSLNDNGVILLSYKDNTYHSKICIYDDINGINVIESKGESVLPIAINNSRQILGNSSKTFLWSRTLGIRYLDIFDSNYNYGIDLNDWGQIIGAYRSSNSDVCASYRPFFWDNASVIDMGPGSEFCKLFEPLGYHVMDINLTSINNNGEIAGHFSYGKFNEKKKKFVPVGQKIFFWDGDIHILPLSIHNHGYPQVVKINNKGTLLVQINSSTYLWNCENGLQVIPNFLGKKLNDSCIILGNIYPSYDFDVPAIWKDGTFITLAELLEIENINMMAPVYSDNYRIEKLIDFIDINNKNQIGCSAVIWNEIYPCLIDTWNGKRENCCFTIR